jgi:hypothetical protein
MRLSPDSRKADVVVVAARYDDGGRRLLQAQAYERRGAVWGDVVLLDREALLGQVRSRRKVFAGEARAEVPGDFILRGAIRARGAAGQPVLVQGASVDGADDLGVPHF